jgi:bifunctional UDP-N-acetylglucosamine pyrophosphorylase/glucosamine-1-phosphate N-acetyltransferase
MPFIKAESIRALARSHEAGKNTLTMFTSKIPSYSGPLAVYSGYGRILRNSKGEIEGIKEFLDASETERQILEVNPGIYMFDSAWLWANIERVQSKNKQAEYYLTDMVELARKDGKKISTLNIHHHEVYGINNQANLEHADLIFDKRS